MEEDSIFLTTSAKTLSLVFKEINRLVLKNGDDSLQHIIEIELNDGSAEIKSIGIVLSTDCDTNFKGKVFIPCPVFQMIAEFSKNDTINIEIKNGEICFDKMRYKAEKIVVLNFDEDDEFEISMHYTPLELLSLRKKYSKASIERRNILRKLENEEENLTNCIYKAYQEIKKYEITIADLNKLIELKMQKYL